MRFGAHLPQIDFEGRARWSAEDLVAYARAAERLGFDTLCVNDHLVFPKPWLDYDAVGIPFEERWKRLDEAVRAMQSLWDPSRGAYSGRFYSTEGVALEPPPHRPGGPPVWIGSWGSDAGMRRVARLANGWLGSAYNTEPELFRSARELLGRQLEQQGRDPASFPNAIATGFMYVTEDANEARRILRDMIAPMIRRDEAEVERRLLVGSAEACIEKLSTYADAGAQAFFVWPVADEIEQLETFAREVVPKVP